MKRKLTRLEIERRLEDAQNQMIYGDFIRDERVYYEALEERNKMRWALNNQDAANDVLDW